ncbi:MAG: DinB family protein [Dehalococcoidia bacterium]|nr:DinB family protein [Dehalococcoidia bacterium]
MDVTTRNGLIARYRSGYDEVVAAQAGITPAELDSADADGWTARQVVHHLADSEWTSALRLRKLLAEPAPVLWAYPEEVWARALFYDRRPIEPSLAALKAARQTTLSILEHLSEGDWAREGWHTESGRYTVERWLEVYAAHAYEHAAQIRAVRGR